MKEETRLLSSLERLESARQMEGLARSVAEFLFKGTLTARRALDRSFRELEAALVEGVDFAELNSHVRMATLVHSGRSFFLFHDLS